MTFFTDEVMTDSKPSKRTRKFEMPRGQAGGQTKNFKGRSNNVVRYVESCGSEIDVSGLISANIAAGARLATKNEAQSLNEKTARTYELRLITLEKFAAENGDDAVLFGDNKRPFMAQTVQTFLQYMCEPKGTMIGSLKCKGLKPPVIRGYVDALNYWFEVFGHSGPYSQEVKAIDGVSKVISKGNPMKSSAVKNTVKQLIKRALRPSRTETARGRKPYEPKKAPPFSLTDLFRIRQYCMKGLQGLRGVWLWTVTLFSFALFLRGEEPLRLKVKHIKLPSNFDVTSGKLPQRLEVKIPWSKADKKAKGVTLTLWSNPLNSKLCPVTALLVWLCLTGVRKNYLFPRVAMNNRKVYPNSPRGVTTYRKTFSELSKSIFGKPYTTHSVRRSAARWAARCGADDSTIKRAGRWKSNSFELYTQDARGELIKEQHDGVAVQDHKIWMFKPLR